MTEENWLNELKQVVERLGPGWQGALQKLLAQQLRPHAAEVARFAADVLGFATKPGDGHELDFGNGTLVIDGQEVARGYVSAGDPGKTVWVEDWAIKDKESFLDLMPSANGATELRADGGYSGGADAQLLAWTTGTNAATAWRATQVGSYINIADVPTAPAITVEAFVLSQGGNTNGHLFRETYTQNGETWIDDYWVFRSLYVRPVAGQGSTIVKISRETAPATLKDRLIALKEEAAANPPVSTNPPALFLFMSSRLHKYSVL